MCLFVRCMMLPNRKPTRLQNFDYSNSGCYLITICTNNKQHLFGCVDDGSVCLNAYGHIAAEEFEDLPRHYKMIEALKYIVMPNHVHAIIAINCAERSRPFPTIPTIIGLYKSGVSKRIHMIKPDIDVWQKSFYDHIIRNENEYLRVWKYIDENPLKWETDEYFTPL